VEQCLRWNAAPIQAHASKPGVAFDQDNFLAQVRCIKCRGVPSRTGADYYNFSFDGVHEKEK
jgi:hypothetical protein